MTPWNRVYDNYDIYDIYDFHSYAWIRPDYPLRPIICAHYEQYKHYKQNSLSLASAYASKENAKHIYHQGYAHKYIFRNRLEPFPQGF